ncbi:MAG: ParB/RepB/Spo0J family partition protein [Gemmataceae bacterium]|nr:ParB/RepB/Spo0J family partition protein [Gemmataceae bacterium]
MTRSRSTSHSSSRKAAKSAPPAAALLSIGRIRPSGTNPRQHIDPDGLAKLADTIKSVGILQPIVVRPKAGKYDLVAGERRLRAAELAGLKRIPATVRRIDDAAALEIQVIENDQREDLTPFEKAAGYKAFMDAAGLSPKELAARIGRSVPSIYDALKLLSLEPALRTAMEQANVPGTVATLVARIPDPKTRAEACGAIINEGCPLGVRDAKKLISDRFMIELKHAPFDPGDAKLIDGVSACTTCPKRTGNCPDAYPGSRADVCTDPSCYAAKCRAHETAQSTQPTAAAAAAESRGGGLDAETLVRRLRLLHRNHHARVKLDMILDNYGEVLLSAPRERGDA